MNKIAERLSLAYNHREKIILDEQQLNDLRLRTVGTDNIKLEHGVRRIKMRSKSAKSDLQNKKVNEKVKNRLLIRYGHVESWMQK